MSDSTIQNILQVRNFAYQLALGAVNKSWGIEVAYGSPEDDPWTKGWYFVQNSMRWDSKIKEYTNTKWLEANKEVPSLELLDIFGYITRTSAGNWRLTPKAFALLEDAPPLSIFISYRRSVSSLLALFIWAELRVEKFTPFLDIRNILAGDEWETLLEKRVKNSNIFILLLGSETLASEVVKQEIEWATGNRGTRIIPILHNGFRPSDLEGTSYAYLNEKNLIVVENDISENYYNAVEKLKDTLWLAAAGQL